MKFWSLILILLVSAATILYIGNTQEDISGPIKKWQSSLSTQLVEDSITLSKYFNSDDDRTILSSLDASLLSIEVKRNDSIIYWNENVSASKSGIENIVPVFKYSDTTSSALVSIDIPIINESLSQSAIKIESLKSASTFSKLTIGQSSFDVKKGDYNHSPWLEFLAWALLFLAMALITFYLAEKFTLRLKQDDSLWFILANWLLLVIIFKGLHYFAPFAGLFGSTPLLWSLNQNSLISQSLAHLIINLWIFGSLIYILNYYFDKYQDKLKYPLVITSWSGFYTFSVFGIACSLIEGFIMSPHVNLEIEDLMTFDMSSFSLIICFSILMILIFQSTQLIQELLHKFGQKGFPKLGAIAAGWGLSLGLLIWTNQMHVSVWIFTSFVAAYTLILDAYTEKREKKITYVIWWLIMFSGFMAVTLFYFGLQKDVKERSSFLTNYYAEPKDSIIQTLTDFQESLLDSDVFLKIATLENSSSLDMKDLYEFIFKSPPESFKNNISIELFDKKSGATLFNNHWADYYKLNQMYVHARKVGKNVYHNPLEDIYLIRLEIARSFPANASWYLFIMHQSSDGVIPLKTNGKFGYAVFSRNKLIEKYDGYESSPTPALLQSAISNTITAGYSLVVTKPSDQYRLVSWKKISGLIKPISLFSFIFTLSGVILLLLSLVNTKLDFLPESLALKFGTRSSLKTKIQLAIILLILITFMIIGAITAFYFKNLIEANQTAKSQQETNSIINNIRSDIQNIDDTEYALTYLVSKLKDLSFVHDKELSIYGQNGKLLGSTGRGNPYMHVPYTLWLNTSINDNQSVTKTKDFAVENREYVPIYLTDDRPFAYVGIDHKSYNSSSGSILDFLSTILNAYIFLFLIAGAIAITIANSITQPLTILAEKLKKFKLGKTNEQLEWKSNDEIGTLIHDYNNLTHELERSAGLLAKTERDLAWREMAKQVAHEIKNPLTPMKLSIQYLDRTAKDYPDKAQELIPRISSTLIEQIDNLSQIANEFSNFASMPQATNEKFVINEVVETIHDLFRKRDDMDINMIEPIDDLYVFADKNHLVRILNNLLKNAIQAIPDYRRGKIEIELKRKENDAIIRITDNGTGIPDHMKDKVFTPNFTTKSSGTGLGLAISANMIESFNGRIYFETKVGEGTDFFVTIPLMRLDDYLTNENRVILD